MGGRFHPSYFILPTSSFLLHPFLLQFNLSQGDNARPKGKGERAKGKGQRGKGTRRTSLSPFPFPLSPFPFQPFSLSKLRRRHPSPALSDQFPGVKVQLVRI